MAGDCRRAPRSQLPPLIRGRSRGAPACFPGPRRGTATPRREHHHHVGHHGRGRDRDPNTTHSRSRTTCRRASSGSAAGSPLGRRRRQCRRRRRGRGHVGRRAGGAGGNRRGCRGSRCHGADRPAPQRSYSPQGRRLPYPRRQRSRVECHGQPCRCPVAPGWWVWPHGACRWWHASRHACCCTPGRTQCGEAQCPPCGRGLFIWCLAVQRPGSRVGSVFFGPYAPPPGCAGRGPYGVVSAGLCSAVGEVAERVSWSRCGSGGCGPACCWRRCGGGLVPVAGRGARADGSG